MMNLERYPVRLARLFVLALSAMTLFGGLILASGCYVGAGPGYRGRGFNRGGGHHNNNRGFNNGNRGRGRGGVVVVGGRGRPQRGGGTVRVR